MKGKKINGNQIAQLKVIGIYSKDAIRRSKAGLREMEKNKVASQGKRHKDAEA